MIHPETKLKVADNTGAQVAHCIRILRKSQLSYGKIGDVIIVSIKKATANSKVAKGTVQKAVIVRTKQSTQRSDGSSISFYDNAVVILDNKLQPIGSRVIGPIAVELRQKFMKIISIAREVI